MKEFESTFQAGLGKGLRTSLLNARNAQALVVSDGLIPEDDTLRSVPELSNLAGVTALGEVFPFPQVHRGQVHIVIFGGTKIWEYVGGSFVLKLQGLTLGTLWSVADFYDYIVATNGQQMVRRNADDHTWEVFTDENIPLGSCVAAVNSQLIIGSPRRAL